MYTQCPKCLTVFSVTEEILAVKAGLVRCGDCENVFNATWNLVDEYEYENEYDDDSSTTWTGDDAVAGDHVEPAVESPPIAERADDVAGSRIANADRDDIDFDDVEFLDAYIEEDTAPAARSRDEDRAGETLDDNAEDSGPAADASITWPDHAGLDDDSAATRDTEPDSVDISDDDIRRTLALDEDFTIDHDDDRRASPASRADERRREPRLDDADAGGLRVTADDGLVPRRPRGQAPAPRSRPVLKRRPAISLKAPERPGRRAEAAAATPAARIDSNVNWVAMPERGRGGARLLWASGVLALVVAVVLQVRYLLVDELYAIAETRPFISMFCDMAGCSAPVRADPGAIRIAQTRVDLHPDVPGAIRINVNLINQASFAQPYPALQLTLSDTDGRIVGRRTYTPAEYLGTEGSGTLLDPGILAVASINLAYPNENAVGFETEVVAGPPR